MRKSINTLLVVNSAKKDKSLGNTVEIDQVADTTKIEELNREENTKIVTTTRISNSEEELYLLSLVAVEVEVGMKEVLRQREAAMKEEADSEAAKAVEGSVVQTLLKVEVDSVEETQKAVVAIEVDSEEESSREAEAVSVEENSQEEVSEEVIPKVEEVTEVARAAVDSEEETLRAEVALEAVRAEEASEEVTSKAEAAIEAAEVALTMRSEKAALMAVTGLSTHLRENNAQRRDRGSESPQDQDQLSIVEEAEVALQAAVL